MENDYHFIKRIIDTADFCPCDICDKYFGVTAPRYVRLRRER